VVKNGEISFFSLETKITTFFARNLLENIKFQNPEWGQGLPRPLPTPITPASAPKLVENSHSNCCLKYENLKSRIRIMRCFPQNVVSFNCPAYFRHERPQGRKRDSPLEIGTKNQNFLENLKSAA